MFVLARDEAYWQAQARGLPEEPDLPLRTLLVALRGAAETDNAPRLAEFLLTHARQREKILQASALETLRTGHVEWAWRLTDLYDLDRRVLEYLLLAWELHATGRFEEAQATVERLRGKALPQLSGWQGAYAAELLVYVLDVSPEAFHVLQQHLLNEAHRDILRNHLITRGHFATAAEIARGTRHEDERTETLATIVEPQAQSGADLIALEAIQRIEDADERAELLANLAMHQAHAGDRAVARATFAAALEAIQGGEDRDEHIQLWQAIIRERTRLRGLTRFTEQWRAEDRLTVLFWVWAVAAWFGMFGDFERNFWFWLWGLICLLVSLPWARRVWSRIRPRPHHRIREKVGQALGAKTATWREIATALEAARRRVKTLKTIVEKQIHAGECVVAVETVQRMRVWTLQVVRVGTRAQESLRRTFDPFHWSDSQSVYDAVNKVEKEYIEILAAVAVAQAQAGDREAAQATFAVALKAARQGLMNEEERAEALRVVAELQGRAGMGEVVQETYVAAMETALTIWHEDERIEALRSIAAQQAQAGDGRAARKTYAAAIGSCTRIVREIP